MHGKFTFDVSEEANNCGPESKPLAVFLSLLEGINPVRKHFTRFDDSDNIMASISDNENKVYSIQQKTEKQELPLTDMWKKVN
jgi:hypothetical protein